MQPSNVCWCAAGVQHTDEVPSPESTGFIHRGAVGYEQEVVPLVWPQRKIEGLAGVEVVEIQQAGDNGAMTYITIADCR